MMSLWRSIVGSSRIYQRTRLLVVMMLVSVSVFLIHCMGVASAGTAASEIAGQASTAQEKSKKRLKREGKKKVAKRKWRRKKRVNEKKTDDSSKRSTPEGPEKGKSATNRKASSPAPVLDLNLAEELPDSQDESSLKLQTRRKRQSLNGQKQVGFDFSNEKMVDLSSLGVLDFDSKEAELAAKGNIDIESEEYRAFLDALDLVARGEYEKAALEFSRFQRESSFAPYVEESEYQLAKVLFKLGLYYGSFDVFRTILQKGLEHRRFQKSIEWLFFLSRKIPGHPGILEVLARFRDVAFPREYVDEHRYLVSKYIFTKAYLASMETHKEVADKATRAGIESMVIDFGSTENSDGANTLDFGGSSREDPSVSGDTIDFDESSREPQKKSSISRDSRREWARKLLLKIRPTSPWYPKARYLMGLYDVLAEDDQAAVTHFQEVVRLTNPRVVDEPDVNTRELGLLSLARVHYSHQQFNRSLYYYEQIGRDSSFWLTALFESSWAFFRRGDFDKALGNLLTLHSPFFASFYFPESVLIEAIIYFEACRYDEARVFTERFLERYRPVMKRLKELASLSKEDVWPSLFQGEAIEVPTSWSRVIEDWLERDPDLKSAKARFDSFQSEEELLNKLGEFLLEAPLGKQLEALYRSSRADLVRTLSSVAKRRLGEEADVLKELMAQSLRVQLEITRAERQRLQGEMRGEEIAEIRPPKNLDVDVGEEHLYWPYEGEFWRDELGTYEVAFSMCDEEEP